MNTDKTPLVNKLILLVLVLILGCLLALIVENHAQKQAQPVSTAEIGNKDEETPPKAAAEPVTYLPVTNRLAGRRSSADAPRPGPVGVNHSAGTEVENAGQSATASQFDAPTFAVPVSLLPASAGEIATEASQISGEVWLTGTPPPETPIQFELSCGGLHLKPMTTRHYLVTEDGRLANAFVYVKEGLKNRKFPVSTDQPFLNNIDCLFEPYVMGVQAGQKFRIGNSDPILHSVNAIPRSNNPFKFGLPPGRQASERSFSLPEVFVRLKCDVHPWMFAYIGVVPHPFFAVTDAEGAFRFPADLPTGKYVIAAVHPKAGESVQEVTIREHETKVLKFTLAVPIERSAKKNTDRMCRFPR